MPVTFSPAKHGANPVADAWLSIRSAEQMLPSKQFGTCGEILQSSIPAEMDALVPMSNGLVNVIIQAYNGHHALVLRPDDVWLSIVGQFSFYVNAHAERLRDQFVAHKGHKKIEVRTYGNRYTVDFGSLARDMTLEMDKHIIDPAVRTWLLPKFSTTTLNDTVVGAVLMMATMKKYFSYGMHLACGIPRVTLEGERSDWQDVLQRTHKLKEYGEEAAAWHRLLVPVLSRFVAAFDEPNSEANLEFWQTVAHHSGGGSGPTYLSGWITAFCVFDEDGKWLGPSLQTIHPASSESDAMGTLQHKILDDYYCCLELRLDGVQYHALNSDKIPGGFAEVDVKLNDNGKIFETVMVAGLVGARVRSSGDKALSASGLNDVVAPLIGWWIYIKREQSREAEQLELADDDYYSRPPSRETPPSGRRKMSMQSYRPRSRSPRRWQP